MEQDLEKLKIIVEAIQPISDDDWDAFSAIWQPFKAKRKQKITALGELENFLYFVVEGVQRVYYFDEKGREATIVFTYAPSFGGVLDSLMLRKVSKYNYETLTPSSFLRTNYEELFSLMEKRPAIQSMVIKGLSDTISGMMERMAELQSFSSEDKFRNLLKRSPHILQLVPHKYLANYLGIDPTNFSKLMNKIKI